MAVTFLSNDDTIDRFPQSAAWCKHVSEWYDSASTSAPCSSSNSTMDAKPFCNAVCKTVISPWIGGLTSAPISSSNFTIPSWPFRTPLCSALPLPALTSARRPSRNFVTATSPLPTARTSAVPLPGSISISAPRSSSSWTSVRWPRSAALESAVPVSRGPGVPQNKKTWLMSAPALNMRKAFSISPSEMIAWSISPAGSVLRCTTFANMLSKFGLKSWISEERILVSPSLRLFSSRSLTAAPWPFEPANRIA